MAALHSIPNSIVLSHLFCTVPEGLGWRERKYARGKLTAYVSDNYAWIDTDYITLSSATVPEVQHAINLINAMNRDGLPEALKHA